MSNAPESDSTDRLLADVLAEAAPAGFRADALGATLRLARRRRIVRRTRHASLVLVPLIAIAIIAWHNLPSPSRKASTPRIASFAAHEIVHTQALPASAFIVTRSLDPITLVTSTSEIAIVRTTPTNAPRLIGDEELLALAAPRRPALVRTGPNAQELVFLDAADPLN